MRRPQQTSNKSRQIVVWTDSDYAGRQADPQVNLLCSGILRWYPLFMDTADVKQWSPPSSAEAEYHSLAAGLQEAPAARSIPAGNLTRPLNLRSNATPAQPELWPTEWVWDEPNTLTSNSCGYNKLYIIVLPELLLYLPMKTSRTLEPNALSSDRLHELWRNIGLSFAGP